MNGQQKSKPWWQDALCMVVFLSAATLIDGLLSIYVSYVNDVMAVYILAVLFISLRTSGYLWGILASVIGVIGTNYFFSYPYWDINFSLRGYPVTFFSMLCVSLITSATTAGLKEQMHRLTAEKQKMQRLNEINQSLSSTGGMEQLIILALKYLREESGSRGAAFAPVKELGFAEGTILLSGEMTAEDVRRDLVQEAAAGDFQTYWRIPVVSQNQNWGTFCLQKLGGEQRLDDDFLKLIVSQVTLALERQLAADREQQIALAAEREKMRSNLLRAISHDLRTPLTSIIGASDAILENQQRINLTDSVSLIQDIHDDAQWLLRMVENILSVTRIGSGGTLAKEWEAIEEVVAEAVGRMRKKWPDINLSVQVPDELVMVPMDAVLIAQVLINLMENGVRHGGRDKALELNVKVEGDWAVLTVRDHGRGLSAEEAEHLFEGFARREQEQNDSTRGLGIGLSLCAAIVRAHGGRLMGSNHPEGGAVFQFTLPMEEDEHEGKSIDCGR